MLFRQWVGWSKTDMSRWLRIDSNRITRWEEGRDKVPVSVIYLIRLIMRYGFQDIGGPVYPEELFNPISREEAESDTRSQLEKFSEPPVKWAHSLPPSQRDSGGE